MTSNNVTSYLYEASKSVPDRPALVMRNKGIEHSITFKELWNRVDAFSTGVKEKGLKPGDRCILMVPMSIELYVTMLGVIKMGAAAVFVDPWIGIDKIVAFCEFAEPAAFIGIPKSHLLRLKSAKLRQIPISITTGKSFLGIPARHSMNKMLQQSGDGNIGDVSPDDAALITFTSGSSGVPKGANRTHGFLSAQYKALKHEFKYEEGDVDMPMFPVFALRNLADGVTSVIPDMDFKNVANISPATIISQIKENNCTTCTASPPFFDQLAQYVSGTGEQLDFRKALTGGAAVSGDQLKQWQAAFHQTPVEIVYGSTEAEPVAHIAVGTWFKKDSELAEGINTGYCMGIPTELLNVKIARISKDVITFPGSWAEIECAPREIGELIVSGAHVCKDYFNNPEAVKENKIIDNEGNLWHRMGDTGYFDEDGYFWLAGRVHSTIVRAENMIHAQLVEKEIAALGMDFRKIAAVGLPDETLGELLTIVIQTDSAVDTAKLKDQCSFPVDKVLVTRQALPVDPRHNTKIDYTILRNMILNKELVINEQQ